MNAELFNYTKVAAYFLWEYTGDENALNLWYCAEDIACFFEQDRILSLSSAQSIAYMDKTTFDYIRFVRHLSFRLFIYTNNNDSDKNWYDTERLIGCTEWLNAIVTIANIYETNKQSINLLGIRSETIKDFYNTN